MAYARQHNRVVITRDSDFVVLSSKGVPHAGIIYWNSRKHFGTVIKEIDRFASDISAEEFRGKVFFV